MTHTTKRNSSDDSFDSKTRDPANRLEANLRWDEFGASTNQRGAFLFRSSRREITNLTKHEKEKFPSPGCFNQGEHLRPKNWSQNKDGRQF